MYCIYPAMSKSPNQLPNSLKRAETSVAETSVAETSVTETSVTETSVAETSVILIVFDGVLCYAHIYTITVSYRR